MKNISSIRPVKLLLLVNKKERELPIMEKIANHIYELAPSSVVFILDVHQPDYQFHILDFLPDVVLTFPFTAIPLSRPFYILKYLTGCFILCFRTEGAISFSSQSQVKWMAGVDTYGPTLVDHEMFWGPRTAEVVGSELLKQNKLAGKERIRIYGYPPYEDYFPRCATHSHPTVPAECLTEIDKYPREKTLLFVTGFHLADYSARDLIQAGDCFDPYGPDAKQELELAIDGVEKAKRFRQHWIDQIIGAANSHLDTLFIVKCHPIEEIIHRRNNLDPYAVFNEHKNILYINQDNISVSQLLPFCSLFFHYGSTCVAESYLLRIKSVFITSDEIYGGGRDTTLSNYYYSDLGWPSSFTTDIDDLSELIAKQSPLTTFTQVSSMKRVLHEVFNVREPHLSGKAEYVPSRDMAHFILSLKASTPLKISESDHFFSRAISSEGGSFVRFLGQKASKALHEQGELSLASDLHQRATALCAKTKMTVPDFLYMAAFCYHGMRGNHKAIRILKAAVATDPGHELSKQLTGLMLPEPSSSAVPITSHNELRNNDTSVGHTTQMPEVFSIETSLACNLRCPECAMGGGMITREKGLLSADLFKTAADKIRPYCKYLYLHIWGEPMLNREIIPMIRYASQFTRTNISTNALTLTPELTEALITSGVNDIIVSIDGVTQEVYEKYRVGGNVKKAFAALEALQGLNRKHGGRVQINPQFIVFKHNQHEMKAFEERCKAMGLSPAFKAPYIRTDNSLLAYSDHPRFHRPYYQDVPSLQEAMRECPNVRNVFTILLDGSVVACCHDHSRKTCFGNIYEQEVLEVWESPAYRQFRRTVTAGKAPRFCIDDCMSYFLSQPSDTDNGDPEAKGMASPQKNEARDETALQRINLCCGPLKLEGYINIDVVPGADMLIDLERQLLPFADDSVDVLVCMSAINYFSRSRGLEIVRDVHRVLKTGGIARFGTQDLRILAERYLHQDRLFYCQKLPDGRDRFPGKTLADKLNEFFYGFRSGDNHCKYVYDFEALREIFFEAGFEIIEEMKYRQSRLSGIELIDNRPEQMFFLEAIKGESPGSSRIASETRVPASGPAVQTASYGPSEGPMAAMRSLAVELWKAGERDRAWQYLLRALEIDPADKIAVSLCSNVLADMQRLDDQAKLFRAYLERNPNDAEVRCALEQNLATPRQTQNDLDSIMRRRGELEALNSHTNVILPDSDHLAACISWLRRAQKANPGGGVSALYYLDSQRWEVDYPETTGYIIPTFLSYSRLTADDRFRDWAKEMGDWEISIQSPEGGAGEPVGVYGQRPRVFNTGQVILGWVALHKETGAPRYLVAARRAADWIIANLDHDGAWRKGTYRGPRAYKSRVAWALLELYAVSGIEKYRDGAERALGWIMTQARDNGWFNSNSLSEPGRPWTHLIGYVLGGLLEICRLDNARFDKGRVLHLLQSAAGAMMQHYLQEKTRASGRFVTLAATFDSNWESSDQWSCVTGSAQVVFFLRRLARHVGDRKLIEVADMLLDDLKQIQLMQDTGDANGYGGLPGSFPVGTGYCIYSIPNWGVKFYADSLLQRIAPVEQQILIG